MTIQAIQIEITGAQFFLVEHSTFIVKRGRFDYDGKKWFWYCFCNVYIIFNTHGIDDNKIDFNIKDDCGYITDMSADHIPA